jgi:RNA polymerase sigma-70 factor (ECF subfamily)
MNDEKIIELYFARNEKAIAETQSKYGKYCHKIAYNILQNNEDADECENDTYLGAWNAIPPTRPKLLSAFLGRITRNIALKKLRSRLTEKRIMTESILSLEELSDCIPNEKDFREEIQAEELALVLNSFLHGLKENERRIFVCRYWYCDSIKDICKQFDCGESKVKMTLSRTRQKLLVYLQERGVFI